MVDFDIYKARKIKSSGTVRMFFVKLLKDNVSIQSLVVGLSKDILNERDGSSDEVVGSDGVAVGARARVDVEGPDVTGGRFKDSRINCDQNNTFRHRGESSLRLG